jgi:HK97 family phage portal protein
VARWSDSSSWELTAEQRALALEAAYACVCLICDTISTLPLHAYRETTDAKGDTVKRQVPLPGWLDEPSPGMPLEDWLWQALGSLALRNNAVGWWTSTDRNGWPTAVVWLPWTSLRLTRPAGLGTRPTYNLGPTAIPADNVTHIRKVILPGASAGMSPVEVFSATFRMGSAAEEHLAKWFEDGAHPSAVLMTDKAIDPEDGKAIISRFEERHKGRRRTFLLHKGLKLGEYQSSPSNSGIEHVLRWVVQQTARIWGLNPEHIGGETGGSLTYSNVESFQLNLLRAIRHWMVRLERGITRMLPRGTYVKFAPAGTLVVDTAARYQAHHLALDDGWQNVDAIRDLEDLPPLPDGKGEAYRAPTSKADPTKRSEE